VRDNYAYVVEGHWWSRSRAWSAERRSAIVVGALLACCSSAFALNPSFDINQYAHTAWTPRDGLFKGVISSVAQTPDGYLWLGTEFGLLRFDGVRTVPWEPPPGQHLPGDRIRSVVVGRDERLWIGTWEGLASWKDGKLTNYPELAGQIIYTLLEDRTETMWAASGGAAAPEKLCAIRNSVVKCYGEGGRFGGGVNSLYQDRQGYLWAGTETGLWRWQPGAAKLFPIPAPGAAHSQALIEDDNGAPLIAVPSGIRRLVQGKAEVYPLPETARQFRPHLLFRSRDGGLWIGTADQGLLHVHEGKADWFAQSDGLTGNYVQSVFEDREGNIWVSTLNGLDRFRDFAVSSISVRQGLSNDRVGSLLAGEDGSVWLGTRDGLNRWKDGRLTVFRAGTSGLPGNLVESVFQQAGRIFVSAGGGLAYFENGRFVPLPAVPAGVHAITGDGSGGLWISQDQALFHLSGGSIVERIPWSRLQRKTVATTLLPDPVRGGLWFGSFQESMAYFKDGEVRASHLGGGGSVESPLNDLHFDGNGALWAATGGGLTRIKDGRVTTLTSRNGLPCDRVHWVAEDDDRSFWLYTECGLVRIRRPEMDAWLTDSTRKIRTAVFDGSDGVSSHANAVSAYSPRVAKAADGKLWFVTGEDVGVIDPRHLPFNKLPPPVHIEQITADRKAYGTSSNQHLPPLVRDLEIDYTALSLVAPEKNHFKFMLEGRDRDWLDVGTRRQAFYSDLAPRNYRFRVMASNNSGVWNEAGASLDFSIDPAYYQTRWFQASCVAAFLALLWGLYRLRLRQIAQGFNARMEERVGERTRIARELHDTLLQSFQGLMLHLQVVEELLPDGPAREKLEQSLERADQAIAEGREAVHDLRSSATTTNDLAQAVRALGNELSVEEGAAFRLVVEGSVRELHPIVRDEIYRIARESIRNAFSHARARQIEAEISYGERLLRVRIRDDGQGIAPAILEEGRPGHYGLPGMRERAGQIGAKLSIWSGVRSGTEIELSIAASIAYGGTSRGKTGRSRRRLFRKAAG
jgi:signal transduction histidine kinase/ligand-binding sensor domain-containing protein